MLENANRLSEIYEKSVHRFGHDIGLPVDFVDIEADWHQRNHFAQAIGIVLVVLTLFMGWQYSPTSSVELKMG